MWSLDPQASVPLWRPRVEDPILVFSTRRGGVSAPPYDTLNLGRSTQDRPESVDENRRRLLAAAGLDPGRLATAGQMHGARVAVVSAPGLHREVDALVTRERGLGLAVSSADCLPILLAAPGAVGAAHCGWRGAAAGIPREALRALCAAAGVEPSAVTAHFGPSIRPPCYRVGPEVARQFPESALRRIDGAWHLDLVAAARLQLLEAGVEPASIADTGACTACEPGWYFSHRRDGGRTGRHWAIAAIPG